MQHSDFKFKALLNDMKGPKTGAAVNDLSYASNAEVDKEIVVGFDDEVKLLRNQLIGITCTNKLEIISIAGMAGIGKTTLARELYTLPMIKPMFDIRAWVCVSHADCVNDVLYAILSSVISDFSEDKIYIWGYKLGEKLTKLFKGHKYLVVLDGILDQKTWHGIKRFFPDDNNGSRVIYTSRDLDTKLHVKLYRPLHVVLRLRTENESWDMFRTKVFGNKNCPSELEEYGKALARKYEGLPFAIVVAAGLVKDNLSVTWWEQIATSCPTFTVSDPNQCMGLLNLCYNHLPSHLKPCLLYIGSFPKNYEIPVKKLLSLWIAQGFIHENGSRKLENVAEDYLMGLIDRSLVMTSEKRFDGKIQTCRIPDFLWDLFSKKGEEHFPPHIYMDVGTSDPLSTVTNMLHVMSLNPVTLSIRSSLGYRFEWRNILKNGGTVLNERYKSIRVIDMEGVCISSFPSDVIHLVNLRYLAIQAHDGSPQSSISNLVNLQTLIILSRKTIVVPKTIWNMVNLTRICIKAGENLIEGPNDNCPGALANLKTLSLVSPLSCKNITSRCRNLEKLGFCGPLISREGDLEFPNIGDMAHLRNLMLINTNFYPVATKSCNPIKFPEKLKKLTLSNTAMNWDEMWVFAWLKNLEVLKLKLYAFIGEKWETGESKFRRLRFLELHDLDLKEWVCSRGNFPRLQRLVVHHCLKLNSVPDALCLESIELMECSTSAHESALKLRKHGKVQKLVLLKSSVNNSPF